MNATAPMFVDGFEEQLAASVTKFMNAMQTQTGNLYIAKEMATAYLAILTERALDERQ